VSLSICLPTADPPARIATILEPLRDEPERREEPFPEAYAVHHWARNRRKLVT
jgi:hypothetical protein